MPKKQTIPNVPTTTSGEPSIAERALLAISDRMEKATKEVVDASAAGNLIRYLLVDQELCPQRAIKAMMVAYEVLNKEIKFE